MANRKNSQASSSAQSASRLTLASLKKRGVELTSHEPHLAILYSRVNSISWAVINGSMTSAEATANADKAFADYQRLEKNADSIDAF